MTLEQRIEALENAVANLTMPNGQSEELAKMMRDTATEVIKNAQRPGGMLNNVENQEAATSRAAKIAMKQLIAEQAK